MSLPPGYEIVADPVTFGEMAYYWKRGERTGWHMSTWQAAADSAWKHQFCK